jgi:DNA end-binding protein Ku
MAARSIASLSLTFGLVSIPVKLYSATESSGSVKFNLLAKDGARVKQQYVSERDGQVVPRNEMIKGYEFEKDHYVTFAPDELKALEEGSRHTIDIQSFVPCDSIDPVYYDKAYYLAPDKRGGKPYQLLMQAMRQTGRCALATWAWKGKQYVVQVRPAEDGLVLQQLLYADEVRSLKDLDIEQVAVSPAELQLAVQLIDQITRERYDPAEYEDEEKKRILAAIDAKIAGKHIVAQPSESETGESAQVIDLMDALRASLKGRGAAGGAKAATAPAAKAAQEPAAAATRERKPARRAKVAEAPAEVAAPPARKRASK